MKKYFFLILTMAVVAIMACTFMRSAKVVVMKSSIHKLKTYATGKLEGKKFAKNSLYARYLGIQDTSRLGKYLKIDFQKNFEKMWECKSNKCSSAVVDEVGSILVKEYFKQFTPVTCKQYCNHITKVVNTLESATDWKTIQKDFKFSKSDIALVKAMAASFDGRDMAAYILTELMSSNNGTLNVTLLDFLLINAGREYVEGIPALGDKKSSFGPYQFTSFAVFQTKEMVRGASLINHAIRKDQKIPGSVNRLRGDDHHRAAFLFVICNLCTLVKNLTPKQKKTLSREWVKNKDDIFLYCATAHHHPASALEAARYWIDNQAKQSFENSCNAMIREYAVKTRNNLKAL